MIVASTVCSRNALSSSDIGHCSFERVCMVMHYHLVTLQLWKSLSRNALSSSDIAVLKEFVW